MFKNKMEKKLYFSTHFHLKTPNKYPWNLRKKQFIQPKKI